MQTNVFRKTWLSIFPMKNRWLFSSKRRLSLSLTHTHTHILSLSFTLSHAHSRTRTFSIVHACTQKHPLSLFQTHTHTRFLLFLSDFLSLTQSLCLYFIFLSKRNTIKLNEESKTLRFREIYFSWVIF